jgi:hypothetical protein
VLLTVLTLFSFKSPKVKSAHVANVGEGTNLRKSTQYNTAQITIKTTFSVLLRFQRPMRAMRQNNQQLPRVRKTVVAQAHQAILLLLLFPVAVTLMR